MHIIPRGLLYFYNSLITEHSHIIISIAIRTSIGVGIIGRIRPRVLHANVSHVGIVVEVVPSNKVNI